MTIIVEKEKTKEKTEIENVTEIFDSWRYVYICSAVGDMTIDKAFPKKGNKFTILP